MRILYGVQTTGNGHLSRSRLVISSLKQLGHDVHVLFSGANDGKFWDLSNLEPFSRFKGLTFVQKDGKISEFRTALQLDILSFYRDVGSFNAKNLDLVISDFEPLSTRIAKKHKIKSIGISHQCAFLYDVPKAPRNYIGKIVTKLFAPVNIGVGLHWYHYNQPIMPPIVNHNLSCDLPLEPKKVLVYLPFENRDDFKKEFLKFPDFSFHIYERRTECLIEDNLHWNPFSRVNFINDLKKCSGVICQAGFELPSEALHLGKKLLLKPVYGQYEQLSNIIALNELGGSRTTLRISQKDIRDWLELPAIKPAGYPDVAGQIAQWITNDPNLSVETLSNSLWDKTLEPPLPANLATV